jgi:uncharacterized protein HemX
MEPNQNPNQFTSPIQATAPQKSHKSAGPIIGILVIIIIMVLGGLYFWGQRLDQQIQQTQEEVPQQSQTQDTQPTSDEVSSIEADLSATNFDTLGSEIDSIDAEAAAQ